MTRVLIDFKIRYVNRDGKSLFAKSIGIKYIVTELKAARKGAGSWILEYHNFDKNSSSHAMMRTNVQCIYFFSVHQSMS